MDPEWVEWVRTRPPGHLHGPNFINDLPGVDPDAPIHQIPTEKEPSRG